MHLYLCPAAARPQKYTPCSHTGGCRGCCYLIFSKDQRKTYFRMNRRVSTYIRGLIFFYFALPVNRLMRVQEMTPMAMPSEML